jgi:hypothetical protein
MASPIYKIICLAALALMNVSIATAASNLATGAVYSYSPPALYELTRDDGDANQLTDSEYAPDTMWTTRKAVGWIAGNAPVEIEIDLGVVKSVGKVCLRSARRAEAGVSFPRRVDIFTAIDGAPYAWAGNIMKGQEAGEGLYLAKNFCSEVFQHDARYIRLLVAARAAYFFTDEVEVWPPDNTHNALNRGSNSSSAPLIKKDLREFVLKHEAMTTMTADLLQRYGSANSASGISAHLNSILIKLSDSSGALGHKQLAAIGRELRQAVQKERVAAGHLLEAKVVDPWKLSTPFDGIGRRVQIDELDMQLGGHAAIAIAIAHANERPVNVRVSAKTIGVSAKALRLKLYEVAMVMRADGVQMGDPLLPLRAGRIDVSEGETKQVWIDVAAAAASVGGHTIRVRVEADIKGNVVSWSLDIPIHVWPLATAPKSASTVVFGYLDSPPLRGYEKAAAFDMLEHGVNTAVLPAGDLPWPKKGSLPGSETIGDYVKFEKVMTTLQGHRQYLFFYGFNSDSYNRTFGRRYAFLSEPWKELFTAWIKEWVSRLKKSGIGYDAFAMFPVDEPHKGVDHDALVAVARLLKSADPNVMVYTSLHQPDVLTNELIDMVNIFQLNGQALTPQVISRLKERRKQVWSYATTGGGKAGNPATFYRAQAWEAFAKGLSGFGFWAYADIGISGTAWNDIDDVGPDYAVIYEGNPGIISSKRWEAWREGVQDFVLLSAALENAHTEAERKTIMMLALDGLSAIGDPMKFNKIRHRLMQFGSAGGIPTPHSSQINGN